MRQKLALLFMFVVVAATLGVISVASAHQCPKDYQPNDPKCRETAVYDDWRPNYIPLFDLPGRDGRDGKQQRYDAQRWRDECNNDGEYRQQCAWLYGGQSVMPYEDSDPAEVDPVDGIFSRPNELHVGYAATHCFLAEGAHDCDRHGSGSEFDTHDSHGGAVYADVCVSANADSKYCRRGMKDTQVGVTIVDHLTCPTGCFDEYHVVRPADKKYRTKQRNATGESVQRIADDPVRHACGYENKGSAC